MPAIAMPIIIMVMVKVRKHYDIVAKQIELTEIAPYHYSIDSIVKTKIELDE